MKRKTLTLIALALWFTSFALGNSNALDSSTFNLILKNPTEKQVYQPIEVPSAKQLTIEVGYGVSNLKNTSTLKELKGAHIKQISFVYSSYTTMPDFNQVALNKKRLSNLYNTQPDLFDEQIEWETIVQTKGGSKKEASKLFHGFVIHYRPAPTKESMEEEVEYLERIFNGESPINALTETIKPPTESIDKEEFPEIATEDVPVMVDDSIFGIIDLELILTPSVFTPDNTVTAVMDRNSHWNKMLVHCDLTGSMSPYSAQLFTWHQLNMDKSKIQHFVFFNDGNFTPDNRKKAGSTGGIYYAVANDFEALTKVAFECMRNGGGGDAPENDVEALLYGMKRCKDCQEIILIADNWANMRDYAFIKKLNRPVRIVLCGTQFGINQQYLDLARATKGSVHTMEEDIENLMDLNEGEEITINGKSYKIKNGKFIPIAKV